MAVRISLQKWLVALSFLFSASRIVVEGSGNGPESWMGGLAIQAATDTNEDDHIFETTIVAEAADIEINGTVVHAMAYNGQVPGPMIRVKEGDLVIVHFVNSLDIPSTIHWHGVAGNNAADGSPLTQYVVPPAGTYTYSFIAANSGNHWYHAHAHTAQTLFHGLYGPLIVASQEEEDLKAQGVLPEDEGTLILSDITYKNDGKIQNIETVNELLHMNGVEGETLLVNGKINAQLQAKAGKPFILRLINTSISRYWRLSGPNMVRIGGEGGLLDEAILSGGSIRGTKIPMPMQMCVSDMDCETPYVCMGTGMMKHCGSMTMTDSGFEEGEILLTPGMRATVVITPPEDAGKFELNWNDFNRGVHSMSMDMSSMCMSSADCTREEYPMCMLMQKGRTMRMCGAMMHHGYQDRESVGVLTVHVEASPQVKYEAFTAGTALRTALRMPIENLAMGVPDVVWTGTANRIDLHEYMDEEGTRFTIDGAERPYSVVGADGFPQPPASARKAKVGDLVEFEVHNHSGMNHPFHLHGFSYQPMYFVDMQHDEGSMLRYDYETTEFVDTIDIPPHTSLVARVRLDDIVGDGGARGRWVFHCHITQHAERGMISELIVS